MSANRRTATYTVTDDYTGDTVTGTARDIEDTLREWFPSAPAEVTKALNTLTLSLRAGRPDTNAATALGLTIFGLIVD